MIPLLRARRPATVRVIDALGGVRVALRILGRDLTRRQYANDSQRARLGGTGSKTVAEANYVDSVSTIRASATPSSTLRLELVFTRTDDDYALAELTRILKRIASRHGQ